MAGLAKIHGSIESLHRSGRSYDLILCAHVVEHAARPHKDLAVLRSMLAPGGSLLLIVSKPHLCTWLLRWKWGHRAFTPAQVARLLAAAGLAGVDIVPFYSGPPSRTSMGYLAHGVD